MIESSLGQRLLGLVVFALGVGGTALNWHTKISERIYYEKSAVAFPVLAVIALSLICFPLDVGAFRRQYGVDRPQSFGQLPTSWKLLLVLAIAAGIGNLYAISHWVP